MAIDIYNFAKENEDGIKDVTRAGLSVASQVGEGRKSAFGDTLSSLSGVASAIPGPVGAIAGVGLGLIGGLAKMGGSNYDGNAIAVEKGKTDSLRNTRFGGDNNALIAQFTSLDDSRVGKVGTNGLFSNGASEKRRALQVDRDNALSNAMTRFNNALNAKRQADADVASANFYAGGGTLIQGGGTHEQNPIGGVPVGIGANGQPNILEEGEVIYDNYVYSKRLRTPKTAEMFGMEVGVPFSDVANKFVTLLEKKNDDTITRNMVDTQMKRLRALHELARIEVAAKQAQKDRKAIAAMGTEVMQQMPPEQQEISEEEMNTFELGGDMQQMPQEYMPTDMAAQQQQQAPQQDTRKVSEKVADFSSNLLKGVADILLAAKGKTKEDETGGDKVTQFLKTLEAYKNEEKSREEEAQATLDPQVPPMPIEGEEEIPVEEDVVVEEEQPNVYAGGGEFTQNEDGTWGWVNALYDPAADQAAQASAQKSIAAYNRSMNIPVATAAGAVVADMFGRTNRPRFGDVRDVVAHTPQMSTQYTPQYLRSVKVVSPLVAEQQAARELAAARRALSSAGSPQQTAAYLAKLNNSDALAKLRSQIYEQESAERNAALAYNNQLREQQANRTAAAIDRFRNEQVAYDNRLLNAYQFGEEKQKTALQARTANMTNLLNHLQGKSQSKLAGEQYMDQLRQRAATNERAIEAQNAAAKIQALQMTQAGRQQRGELKTLMDIVGGNNNPGPIGTPPIVAPIVTTPIVEPPVIPERPWEKPGYVNPYVNQ